MSATCEARIESNETSWRVFMIVSWQRPVSGPLGLGRGSERNTRLATDQGSWR
jgi:hypothetical protein